jgi:hypothetical protein
MASLTFQSYILPLSHLNTNNEILLISNGTQIVCDFIPNIPDITSTPIAIDKLAMTRFYFPTYLIPYCQYPSNIRYEPNREKFEYVSNSSYLFSDTVPIQNSYTPNINVAYNLSDYNRELMEKLGVSLPDYLESNQAMETNLIETIADDDDDDGGDGGEESGEEVSSSEFGMPQMNTFFNPQF